MIYTSFVTTDNGYQKVIDYYLLPTLKKWELQYDIDYISSVGRWSNNILYKSTFLKQMLLKHNKPIVSLDADAEILQYPYRFDQLSNSDYDIGLHYLDNGLQWRNIPSPNGKKEALGGTLYLDYNEKVLAFLDEWVELQKQEKGYPQKLMQRLLEKNTYNLKIHKLPYSYATIVKQDDSLPLHMIKKEEIVILHNQVSRRLRRG